MPAMEPFGYAGVRDDSPEDNSYIEGLLGRFGKLSLCRCNQISLVLFHGPIRLLPVFCNNSGLSHLFWLRKQSDYMHKQNQEIK